MTRGPRSFLEFSKRLPSPPWPRCSRPSHLLAPPPARNRSPTASVRQCGAIAFRSDAPGVAATGSFVRRIEHYIARKHDQRTVRDPATGSVRVIVNRPARRSPDSRTTRSHREAPPPTNSRPAISAISRPVRPLLISSPRSKLEDDFQGCNHAGRPRRQRRHLSPLLAIAATRRSARAPSGAHWLGLRRTSRRCPSFSSPPRSSRSPAMRTPGAAILDNAFHACRGFPGAGYPALIQSEFGNDYRLRPRHDHDAISGYPRSREFLARSPIAATERGCRLTAIRCIWPQLRTSQIGVPPPVYSKYPTPDKEASSSRSHAAAAEQQFIRTSPQSRRPIEVSGRRSPASAPMRRSATRLALRAADDREGSTDLRYWSRTDPRRSTAHLDLQAR